MYTPTPETRRWALGLLERVRARYVDGISALARSARFASDPSYAARLTRASAQVRRIPLWFGDLTKQRADATVNFTSESPEFWESLQAFLRARPAPLALVVDDDYLGQLGVLRANSLGVKAENDLTEVLAHEMGHVFDSQINPELYYAGVGSAYSPTGEVDHAAWVASGAEARADHYAQLFLGRPFVSRVHGHVVAQPVSIVRDPNAAAWVT